MSCLRSENDARGLILLCKISPLIVCNYKKKKKIRKVRILWGGVENGKKKACVLKKYDTITRD